MELTHYLEHLMGRFTSQKYKNTNFINKELSKKGAITNASVSEYETKFYIEGLYKDIEFYIDLLSNTLYNFYIDNNIIKQEKNAVKQELLNIISDDLYNFELNIFKYMNKNISYQFDYEKHIDFLDKYNTNNLYKYMKNHILTNNIVISISCPDTKINQTKILIKKYFEKIPRNENNNIKYSKKYFNNKNIKILYIKNKNHDNSIIRYVINDNIKLYSKKHLCLIFLKYILLNFETGIFYNILRLKLGYIYNISLNINIDLYDPKLSSYNIETNIHYEKIHLVIDEIFNIINTFIITEEDVISAKNKIIINYDKKIFNNLTSYNSYYEKFLRHKIPIIEQSELKRLLLNISKEDIQKYSKIFKKDLLSKSLIFYYSKKNVNKSIKKLLDKKKFYKSLNYINVK